MTEEETFIYRFRAGQKEAFMEDLRAEAKAYASMAARRSADYPPAAAVFARFTRRGEELFDDREREYLARCRLGQWALGQE